MNTNTFMVVFVLFWVGYLIGALVVYYAIRRKR